MSDAVHPPLILAVLYEDGIAADRMLASIGYRLRDAGVAVAGLVQHNTFVRDRAKCDMDIEELASGTVVRVSENRGRAARGCRLDHGALSHVSALLKEAIAAEPAILILNKFGKTEAEGRGTRDVVAEAALREIPMMIGVPYRNLDQWRLFAGALAEECVTDSPRIAAWLKERGFPGPPKKAGTCDSDVADLSGAAAPVK